GKAFVAATVIIFGSATLVFGTTASKLDMRNVSRHSKTSNTRVNH
ncbi:hypothetical protein AALP_AAs67921U000100, partial [Arabis alpina]